MYLKIFLIIFNIELIAIIIYIIARQISEINNYNKISKEFNKMLGE